MDKALEDGFYLVKDGAIYKVDIPIDYRPSRSIDLTTGQVHYPRNIDMVKHANKETLAAMFAHGCPPIKDCPRHEDEEEPNGHCVKCWAEWFEMEARDGI